jgi:hypothetical protein
MRLGVVTKMEESKVKKDQSIKKPRLTCLKEISIWVKDKVKGKVSGTK